MRVFVPAIYGHDWVTFEEILRIMARAIELERGVWRMDPCSESVWTATSAKVNN